MNNYQTLNRLRARNEFIPDPPSLPSAEEVDRAAQLLNCQFPPSYRQYLLKYADVTVGQFELYWVFQDGSRLDLVKNATDAWTYFGLPASLLPFVEDRGRYYCFDTSAPAPEYPVVCWFQEGGVIEETWPDFLDWVKQCWLGEEVDGLRPVEARQMVDEGRRTVDDEEAGPRNEGQVQDDGGRTVDGGRQTMDDEEARLRNEGRRTEDETLGLRSEDQAPEGEGFGRQLG